MKRYVTYRRVSTAEQGKSGLGLKAQDTDIRLYLEGFVEEPFEVLAEFVEVETGTADDRPKFGNGP
jgi:DNA invertase Pin-like site-specific DNA recombinase